MFYLIARGEGLTIGERLRIVKLGDDHSDVSSCMRMSSKWICSTAYKMLVVFGVDPGFDIKKLTAIM